MLKKSAFGNTQNISVYFMKHQLLKTIQFYDLHSNQIEEDIEKSELRLSLILLQNKLWQISSINDSISQIKYDIYSSSILLRGLIEHYLIFFYVVTEIEKSKDDFVGISWYFIYKIAEDFKQENYINKIKAIKNREQINTLNLLFEKYPGLTQSEYEKINTIGNKFAKLDVIAKQLINNSDASEEIPNKIRVNVELLEFYNTLSSYVHGGPMAELETSSQLNIDENADFRREKILSISETLTYAAFYFFFENLNLLTNNKYKNYR